MGLEGPIISAHSGIRKFTDHGSVLDAEVRKEIQSADVDRTKRRAENAEEEPQIRAFEAGRGGGRDRRRSDRELAFHPIVPPPLEPRVVSAAASGVFSVRIGTFYDRREHLGHVAVRVGDVAAFAAADDDGGDGSDRALGA